MRPDSSRRSNGRVSHCELVWGLWLVAHVAAAGGCRVWLGGNLLETLPAELCAMFPNAVVLGLTNNRLRTLPRELGQMQRLQS